MRAGEPWLTNLRGKCVKEAHVPPLFAGRQLD